ncbi:MAG: hypothetical protein LAT50_17150, partial [Ectothiorhodospiraceae bacterium]|nr:hypothetical protein [Ectothiorhodospiraceae bacterium]
ESGRGDRLGTEHQAKTASIPARAGLRQLILAAEKALDQRFLSRFTPSKKPISRKTSYLSTHW